MGLRSCSSASLQHYKDAHAAASDQPPRAPCAHHDAAQSYWNKGRGAANESRLHGRKFGANKRGRLAAPKMGPRNGPRVPAVQLGTKYGGCETATPKLSPPGGPNFGAANSSIFRLNLALFTRGPQTSAQSGKLRTTTSAGSFLVEVSDLVNMRETCTGEAHAREARIVEIFRPQIWTCANWQLLQTCVRDIARPLRPHPAGFEAFRGLPKPYSWGFEASLMGFRGLSRPGEASTKSQNPFSLKDYEASGTGAYNTIKGVPAKPRARTNPGCLSSFP